MVSQKGRVMFSDSIQNRFFRLLVGTALVFCLAASPAHAKKHGAEDSSDKGGLFQPPTAITKPSLILDTSIPKVSNRKGDELRQSAPDAMSVTPDVVTPAAAPATRPSGIIPVKAFEPARTIESMRLRSLFE